MERNATIASAPSVSNFAWPYGCCSSGACAATRASNSPIRLLNASTDECAASASTLSAPLWIPAIAFAITTARLAASVTARTRRMPAWRGRGGGERGEGVGGGGHLPRPAGGAARGGPGGAGGGCGFEGGG